MLTIYGNRKSGSSNKVEYIAKILKLKYEYKDLDFQKDLKTPQYLKIHPVGKIPAIDDDGFILFESGAIIRYLCDKQGHELYPRDVKQRALVDQWTDFVNLHVGTALGKIAYARIFAPMMGALVDENAAQEGVALLNRFLPIIESQFQKHKFLVGNSLTLADISLFAAFEYADAAKVDLSGYKSLTAWRVSLMQMEFYTSMPPSKA